MAELALDDDERHAFSGNLDRVGVAQLVRRKAAPDAYRGSGPPQLCAGGGGRPVVAASCAVDDAQQGSDGKLVSQLEPGVEFVPAPSVHADLAAAPALAAADQERAAALIESPSVRASASWIRSPARHKITTQGA